MAYFKAVIDTDFVKQLNHLGERSDKIAQLMLDDAGQILADALEAEIRSKHKDSGELADSIEVKTYKDKNDNWVAWAYPEGRSKRLMRKGKVYSRSKHGRKTSGKALYNTDKLFFIEYGTSKQPARPFIDSMVKNVTGKVISNMQEIFDREVGKQ
jgi:HK97 gp10 family phage protein